MKNRKPHVPTVPQYVVLEPIKDGKGLIWIENGKAEGNYEILELSRGIYRLTKYVMVEVAAGKHEPAVEKVYDVVILGNVSCDCWGQLRWGHRHHCKHVACLRDAFLTGKLYPTPAYSPNLPPVRD